MKILVAIKRVIDYNVQVRVKQDNSSVDLTNIKMAINPFCERALEEAVKLKESSKALEVVAVCIGEQAAAEQLRAALALGADRAILVETVADLSSLNVAKLLHGVVKKENPGLILLGKQAIDSDNSQTPQMLAGLMNCAQGAFVSKLELNDDNVQIVREIDGGVQKLRLTLPAVISAELHLNEPRYAKLPDIMKAKKKPLDVITVEQLGVTITNHLTTIKVTEPAKRSAGIKVSSVDELISQLKTNKVI